MIATLGHICRGRLEIGLGAGWNEQESAAYGLELGTPGQRSDRFEEACEISTRLLSTHRALSFLAVGTTS